MTRTRRNAIAAGIVALVLAVAGGTVANAQTAIPGNPTGAPVHHPTQHADPHCAGTASGVKHLYVSISKQYLWACTGPVLYLGTSVTTGASALRNVHDATPTGTWRIYNKVRNTVLAGRDANGSWFDHVKYWMPFWLGYGFHDSSWQTFPYGSSLYKTKGSHGCVHVPVSALGTIFNWAPVGTLVTIRS